MHIKSEYEERIRRCQYVTRLSFGRRMLRDDGGPNRYFLMYLFCEESMAVQYLKDIGLLRSKMNFTYRTTCSRRSARQNASHPTCNSCISLQTLTGLCALFPALNAPLDGPRSVRHLHYHVGPRNNPWVRVLRCYFF